MHKILIVDDDAHIRDVVNFALTQAGFATEQAPDGMQALACIKLTKPDLMVLDIMMPGIDGIEVCRRVRQNSRIPIVFLSSKEEEVDRILGLELGGDDYIIKPFSPRELVARIRAVLRRVEDTLVASSAKASCLRHGDLSLDLEQHKVSWQSSELVLTVTEFGLLYCLLRHPGKVFSRDELMQTAYNFHNVVSDRTIDSHMRRLRAKLKDLGAEPIETVHGVGYKLKKS